MTGDPRLVRVLLACYPTGWRHRYGDEYAQLLCDMRVHRKPALIVDSLRGAARAHGGVLMRSPMTVVIWAVGLFTVAGTAFQKLAEDFTGIAHGVYNLLVVAAAVALIALVIAAAPTAFALLRGRDTAAWKYLAVPVVGVAALIGVLVLASAVGHGHGVHSAANIFAFVLVALAGIGVVAATAWAATVVLRRLPAEPPARLRPVALAVVTVGMAVTTVAALIWGLRVHTGDPTGFRGDNGLLATPFVPSWIVIVVLMATATGLAATASRRQFSA